MVGTQPSTTPRVVIRDAGIHDNQGVVGVGVEGFIVDGDLSSAYPVSLTMFNALWYENEVTSAYRYQSPLLGLYGKSYGNVQNITMVDNWAWANIEIAEYATIYLDDSIMAADETTSHENCDDPGTTPIEECPVMVDTTSIPGACVVDEIGRWQMDPGDMGSGGPCAPTKEVSGDPHFANCDSGLQRYCMDQSPSVMVDEASEMVSSLPTDQSYIHTLDYFTDSSKDEDADIDELDFGFHHRPLP